MPDGIQRGIRIGQQLAIPEAQDAEAPSYQFGIAMNIAITSHVLATVKLDDQLGLVAGKICNAGADRYLPTKFVANKAPVSQ
jgi:hypothetical protein